MEISAKKDGNKSLCAMADVCLSPPSPPAGPIPIPYPNTATASNTTSGSKTVKIGGQEVGQKNSSSYKKSNGDEAATKSLGMGVVSHTIQGKMKHAAWSMDVKIQGKNAIRHMDLTTHNHINQSNLAVVLNLANQKIANGEPLNCEELDALNQDARENELRPSAKKRKNLTLTTASHTPAGDGPSSYMKATAPGKKSIVRSPKQDGYQDSNKKTTMSCSGEDYGARSPRASSVENNKTRNHTEPKLMESFFPGGEASDAGSLTMKIYHKSGETVDAMPCGSCKTAICKAKECGLDIKLCNKANEPVTPPCTSGEAQSDQTWVDLGL